MDTWKTLLMVVVVATLAACGEEGDEAPGPNTIEGAVSYDGDLDGSLIIGAFPNYPPTTPPVSFWTIASPSFPEGFSLENVAAGDYYVIATLDVGRDNPTAPGPEDLQGASEMVTVTNELGAQVQISIVEQ